MLVEFTSDIYIYTRDANGFYSLSYKFRYYREYVWIYTGQGSFFLASDNTFVSRVILFEIIYRAVIELKQLRQLKLANLARERRKDGWKRNEYFWDTLGGKGVRFLNGRTRAMTAINYLGWSLSKVCTHLAVSCETISWKPAKEFLRFTSSASVIPFHLTVPMRMPVNGEWRGRKVSPTRKGKIVNGLARIPFFCNSDRLILSISPVVFILFFCFSYHPEHWRNLCSR